jgi:acetyl-CoA synthetase
MSETVYTPNEVAKRLKVDRDTIYKLLQDGELKGKKVGRLWRVSDSNLSEYLKE